MKEIIDTLLTQDRFLVASHVDPDGDAIGSLVAMGLALEENGKEVVMYNESPIPSPYRFLKGVDQVTCDTPSLKNCEPEMDSDPCNLIRDRYVLWFLHGQELCGERSVVFIF